MNNRLSVVGVLIGSIAVGVKLKSLLANRSDNNNPQKSEYIVENERDELSANTECEDSVPCQDTSCRKEFKNEKGMKAHFNVKHSE